MHEVTVPRENANDDQVRIAAIYVENGQSIKQGDLLYEFETSKASIEVLAEASGVVQGLKNVVGDLVSVGTLLFKISDGNTQPDAQTECTRKQNADLGSTEHGYFGVSDEARELLNRGQEPLVKTKWLTSSSFKPSVVATATRDSQDKVDSKKINVVQPEYASLTFRKQEEIKALQSSDECLSSTLGVPITGRKRRIDDGIFSDKIVDLVIYEVTAVLSGEFNDLNCQFSSSHKLVKNEYPQGGIALDDKNNLVVVNVGQFRTLKELQSNLLELVEKFDERKLASHDFVGITFTVTDLSATQINFVQPIINNGQAFIIGIVRSTIGFQLFGTFDHRVTEGLRFSHFLQEVARRVGLYLEDNLYLQKDATNCIRCGVTIEEDRGRGNRGFVNIFDGTQKLVCRGCFDGW